MPYKGLLNSYTARSHSALTQTLTVRSKRAELFDGLSALASSQGHERGLVGAMSQSAFKRRRRQHRVECGHEVPPEL
eukprot:1827992-Alexandrium_andersonii.AAC.1